MLLYFSQQLIVLTVELLGFPGCQTFTFKFHCLIDYCLFLLEESFALIGPMSIEYNAAAYHFAT
jgi:hypothetical protein